MRRLDLFDNTGFDRGASKVKEAAWIFVSGMFVSTWIPGSFLRSMLLTIFGSKLGSNIVFKPRIRVKFPWKLEIGDNCWIGEGVWIENVSEVRIGSNVCVSQGAFMCSGNHAWRSETFDLLPQPILIENDVWLCAFSCVAPGSIVKSGAVVTMGCMASGIVPSNSVVHK